MSHQRDQNPMQEIQIEKVVVNISVGQSGEPLVKAMTVLEQLTGQQPVQRRAKQTIRGFGIRSGEPMACMVTLRDERAEKFLERALEAVDNRINPQSFDRTGNFAFGIQEHIDIPGTRYDPNLGIIGMDVIVSLERPGYRVSRRKRGQSKIGHTHRVSPEEAKNFVEENFEVKVEEEIE